MFEFNPPLPVIRDHNIQVRFSGTEQIVPKGDRTLSALTLTAERLLQPILVTAPGRAGSTVLMQKLAAHPLVSVANRYPFETELLKYYSHAFSILTAPGDHERSGKPESFVDNHRFLGANPYYVLPFATAFADAGRFHAFYGTTVPRELAGAFRNIIGGFYTSLAEDQAKPGAMFFAEKCQLAGLARWFARSLFAGTREIVLVRDPRDILCSYKSFWSHSTAEAIRLLKLSTNQLMAIGREQRADVLIVRYEDLVQQEAETLARCAAFIGMSDFAAANAEAEQALFKEHGTSKSPAKSIGRWRRELAAEDVQTCGREFAAYLEMYDYEV